MLRVPTGETIAALMTRSGKVTLDPRLVSWRWRVFWSTYLCYFGMYFCRKPFYVAKATLGEHFGLTATALGFLESAYLVAYTLGQFTAGGIGNRLGPRVTLIAGMVASIVASVAFGVTDVFAVFGIAMVLNGLGQATGWSGGVGTMGNWFHKRERGTWMGWWATNYQVGAFAATFLASWLLGHFGFRASFFGGAAVLAAILLFFVPNQRNRPEDVDLPPVEDPAETSDSDSDAPPTSVEANEGGWTRDAIVTVLLVGTFYFFVKFIRYALWSWVPYFLKLNYALSAESSGYFSTLFDAAGIPGVIVAGWVSDRYFRSRRTIVSFVFLLGLTGSCLAMWKLGGSAVWIFGAALALIGFTLYGPDALMTGAGAIEIGSRENATLAAGIINGMGQLGAVVQALAIGKLYDKLGGELGPIFALLLGSAGMATVLLGVVLIRNRMGRSSL